MFWLYIVCYFFSLFALFFFSVKNPKNFDIFFGEKSSSQKNNKDFSNGINEENKNTLKEIVIEDIENDSNNLKNFINIKMIDIDGKEECKINKGIFASDHYAMFCDMEINIKKWENKK